VESDEHHVGVYASKKDGRVLKADHPKSIVAWKSGIPYNCNYNHKWKVCKCGSALSFITGILSLWSCHHMSKYGKLDDSIGRKLFGSTL
jgi:hypothetical protein